MIRALVVDDDPSILKAVRVLLDREGFSVAVAGSGAEAREQWVATKPQVVVLDLDLPDARGVDLLSELRAWDPAVGVVVFTATEDVEQVVECMTLGASDYVTKPFARARLLTSVRNASERAQLHRQVDSLSSQLRGEQGVGTLCGEAEVMRSVKELLARAAPVGVAVLLTGESGTGKEVAARAVHAESPRRVGPLVTVNCGALPAGLAESELFGHEKGAFTGAVSSRAGCFERADGGTLFLDEVGELEFPLQVKLLRALQERVVQRVGGSREIPVDVRVIAATNRDLEACVSEGTFREDLYYRLAVFPVRLPPLREREGDVELLARRFLAEFVETHRRADLVGFEPRALEALVGYSWPGNVRELRNVLERAVILERGSRINLGALPDPVVCALEASGQASEPGAAPPSAQEPIVPLAELERRALEHALRVTGGNLKLAAERLGIGRATIYRKLERHGISPRAS